MLPDQEIEKLIRMRYVDFKLLGTAKQQWEIADMGLIEKRVYNSEYLEYGMEKIPYLLNYDSSDRLMEEKIKKEGSEVAQYLASERRNYSELPLYLSNSWMMADSG